MDEPTPEEITQHYRAMGDSVWLINAIIAGEQEGGADVVDRNVNHLKLMKAKPFWTDEDFTEVDAAIAAGETYLAG